MTPEELIKYLVGGVLILALLLVLVSFSYSRLNSENNANINVCNENQAVYENYQHVAESYVRNLSMNLSDANFKLSITEQKLYDQLDLWNTTTDFLKQGYNITCVYSDTPYWSPKSPGCVARAGCYGPTYSWEHLISCTEDNRTVPVNGSEAAT